MASYQAIRDAGKTIIKLLRDNLCPEPIPKPELIELCSPSEANDFALTLYLYAIRKFSDGGSQSGKAIALELHYLLTAFSKAEEKTRTYDEQSILGKAVEVLLSNSILRGSLLQGTLSENNEELRVVQSDLTLDEQSKIWAFPNVPYKLSVAYIAGPIYIDSSSRIGSIGARVIR